MIETAPLAIMVLCIVAWCFYLYGRKHGEAQGYARGEAETIKNLRKRGDVYIVTKK